MKNYYEILGVQADATPDEIKAAYKTKAQKMHPDKGGDELEFMWLQEAYAVLSDAERRDHYDLTGDGDKVDQASQARAVLARLFTATVDEMLMGKGKQDDFLSQLRSAQTPSDERIIKAMRAKLINRNQMLKKAMVDLKAHLKKIDSMCSRITFKHDGPDDILVRLFEDKTKQINASLASCENEKTVNEQVLKMLEEGYVERSDESPEFTTTTMNVPRHQSSIFPYPGA